ncbi:MAG: hypothetical protein JRH16_11845 [Deltaproteobacteria bacterium]|nr:hypothetical protein [Deltaproteobacteria bacterium]MBW2363047.1 hypothetical protein [Deltaproteobacteria bacterium]
MDYLDLKKLGAIDPIAFQACEPYPFVNPEGLLHQEAHRKLVENLPPLELFTKIQSKRRRYGQKSHDRYTLEYEDGLPLPSPWQEFIDELRGEPYRALLCRLLGIPDLEPRFHWHWATVGESVSPHCDAKRKLGSHVFYLNTEEEWDPTWGGQTLVLDDGGRFSSDSSPAFEDFEEIACAQASGNWSFIFSRRGNSWHGVKEVVCPEGHFRKVFIVVIDKPGLRRRLTRTLSGS